MRHRSTANAAREYLATKPLSDDSVANPSEGQRPLSASCVWSQYADKLANKKRSADEAAPEAKAARAV